MYIFTSMNNTLIDIAKFLSDLETIANNMPDLCLHNYKGSTDCGEFDFEINLGGYTLDLKGCLEATRLSYYPATREVPQEYCDKYQCFIIDAWVSNAEGDVILTLKDADRMEVKAVIENLYN